LLGDETNPVTADFADDCGVDPVSQSQILLFSIRQKLPPSLSVSGELKTSGNAVNGVVVPAAAVLRHEGKGWVYAQVETNRFVRVEVPLDALTDGGWFVPEGLSVTNRIVTTGAQTILSAELGGGFGTGGRD
jgi:hypothetical protein